MTVECGEPDAPARTRASDRGTSCGEPEAPARTPLLPRWRVGLTSVEDGEPEAPARTRASDRGTSCGEPEAPARTLLLPRWRVGLTTDLVVVQAKKLSQCFQESMAAGFVGLLGQRRDRAVKELILQ